MEPDIGNVRSYFANLQGQICAALEGLEPAARFSDDPVQTAGGGLSRPRVLSAGEHLEKVAVHFTHSLGERLPEAATERMGPPDGERLAGLPFVALALSMICHPRNPYVPTMHANLRFFVVGGEHWYFGGGFDLTPCYPFMEDVVHWHRQAREACTPLGAELYSRCKRQCDEYFRLTHRNEARGVGGLFFDDWKEGGFAQSFAFVRSVGDHILPAYLPIVERRRGKKYTKRQRDFQAIRRGRYVEFNLLLDRGTRYGLQSGRNVESILASLPPAASWEYRWIAQEGSPEAELAGYLQPRDWLEEG
jgi:coproporphyrinogen III oxidase